MRFSIVSVLASMALLACAQQDEKAATDAAAKTTAAAPNGEAAYLEHCAGCHETGMLGAPREGEPTDWRGRSSLWQAVLMEHARSGYFDMPARGGKSELPDAVVDAAAEYMLEQTFTDLPED